MISYDMQQSSPEWFEARRGKPTSSCFHRICTPVGMKLAKGARTYAQELLAAVATVGIPLGVHSYTNPAIENGKEMEPEAADYYAAFHTKAKVYEIGFTTTDYGRFGGSPDRMVGDDGVLEIKCPQPNTHVAWLDDECLPVKHAAQCYGHLLTTDRAWCDFLSYCPGMPELIVRVERDENYDKLVEVLELFWTMFETMKAKPCFAELFTKENN